MILVKLPPGTYATKPVPLYGFDLSVDQRELNPPRGLWGKLKNTTVDTITWTGTGGFELPTWAIDYLRMFSGSIAHSVMCYRFGLDPL